MTLNKVKTILQELDQYKCTGGKTYKEVSLFLEKEGTTHNLEEAEVLLLKIKNKVHVSEVK